MSPRIAKLSDAEVSVMMALWSATEPVPRSWLEGQLAYKCWNSLTINTYLLRLTEKGTITAQKHGKANYYTPVVSKEEYLELENHSFLEKLYGSSLESFMAAICSQKGLDNKEIDELQDYLEGLKGGEPHA